MDWFNYIGLIFIIALMIPNIVFTIKSKSEQNVRYDKTMEIFEQIGRYGTMIFMVFNVPYTTFGFYFANAQIVYIAINTVLIIAYYLSWIAFWKKDCLAKSVMLSVIPSSLFIMSGILLANIPLIVFAILFAVFHIAISVKNVL